MMSLCCSVNVWMSYRNTGSSWRPLLASVEKSMEAAERGQGLENKCQIVIGQVALNRSKPVRAGPDESRPVGLKLINLLQVEITRCPTGGRS